VAYRFKNVTAIQEHGDQAAYRVERHADIGPDTQLTTVVKTQDSAI
jgi:hypothetical protein